MKNILKSIIKLIRVRQWIKNLFVLAPLLFSGKFTSIDSCYFAAISVIAFCIASSITYVYNDIKDIEFDRSHSYKRHTRPLASGELSVSAANRLLIILFILLSSVILHANDSMLLMLIFCYLVINYLYTNWTKNIPIFDLFSIALGFVLRLLAGSYAIKSQYSEWMIVTTISVSLFLASIKRLQELKILQEGNTSGTRLVLRQYSVPLVEKLALISSICCLIFYSIFALINNNKIVLTIPFVMYGFFRYWFLVEINKDGESPTDVVLKDLHIITTILLWAFTVAILLV